MFYLFPPSEIIVFDTFLTVLPMCFLLCLLSLCLFLPLCLSFSPSLSHVRTMGAYPALWMSFLRLVFSVYTRLTGLTMLHSPFDNKMTNFLKVQNKKGIHSLILVFSVNTGKMWFSQCTVLSCIWVGKQSVVFVLWFLTAIYYIGR